MHIRPSHLISMCLVFLYIMLSVGGLDSQGEQGEGDGQGESNEWGLNYDDPPMPEFIWSIDWHPAGDTIAVGWGPEVCNNASNDYSVHVVDAVTQAIINRIGPGPLWCSSMEIDWSPDGTQLITNDTIGNLYLWTIGELFTGGFTGVPNSRFQTSWSPDGSLVVTADSSTLWIRIWDPTTSQAVYILSTSPPLDRSYGTSVDWSPDGSQIAIASGDIYLWDVSTQQVMFAFYGREARLIRWSPDGSRLAISRADNTLEVLDAATSWTLVSMSGHSGRITELRWSPDGTRLASSSDDGSVRVWDANSGAELQHLLSDKRINDLDWNPDGTQLAYGGYAGTLEIIPVAGVEV